MTIRTNKTQYSLMVSGHVFRISVYYYHIITGSIHIIIYRYHHTVVSVVPSKMRIFMVNKNIDVAHSPPRPNKYTMVRLYNNNNLGNVKLPLLIIFEKQLPAAPAITGTYLEC